MGRQSSGSHQAVIIFSSCVDCHSTQSISSSSDSSGISGPFAAFFFAGAFFFFAAFFFFWLRFLFRYCLFFLDIIIRIHFHLLTLLFFLLFQHCIDCILLLRLLFLLRSSCFFLFTFCLFRSHIACARIINSIHILRIIVDILLPFGKLHSLQSALILFAQRSHLRFETHTALFIPCSIRNSIGFILFKFIVNLFLTRKCFVGINTQILNAK